MHDVAHASQHEMREDLDFEASLDSAQRGVGLGDPVQRNRHVAIVARDGGVLDDVRRDEIPDVVEEAGDLAIHAASFHTEDAVEAPITTAVRAAGTNPINARFRKRFMISSP